MLQLQYQIHKILNSEYKIFFTILIYFIIYFSFNSSKIVYCMTENTDIPEIAEAKSLRENQFKKLIHREIYSYLEPAREIEQLTNALAEQKARAQNAYDAAGRFQNDYRNEIQLLGQMRRYPKQNELINYKDYFLNFTFNKHIISFNFEEGFVKDINFDLSKYLNKEITISNIWFKIEHNNPPLYQLL